MTGLRSDEGIGLGLRALALFCQPLLKLKWVEGKEGYFGSLELEILYLGLFLFDFKGRVGGFGIFIGKIWV